MKKTKRHPKPWFTVIGLWVGSSERYAESVRACSGDDAAARISRRTKRKVLVAGVVSGRVKTVDTGTFAQDSEKP